MARRSVRPFLVRDFQANIVDNSATVALRSYLANIPKVTVKGVEFDAAAQVGSRLTLRASGALADGEYASYPSGPCPIERTGTGTARCDLTGNALPGLPKWTGSAGGEYRMPVGSGALFLRADAVTRTRVRGEATGSAYTINQGPYVGQWQRRLSFGRLEGGSVRAEPVRQGLYAESDGAGGQ